MHYLRPTTADDVAYVAEHMRTEDIAEVAAASGRSPLSALSFCVAFSDAPLTLTDPGSGRVGGIMGVTREDAIVGHVWMLGTPLIEALPVTFLRRCGLVVSGLNQVYPLLTNAVDERNAVHVKWLRWLGFRFIRRIPDYGVERRPFLEFARVTGN